MKSERLKHFKLLLFFIFLFPFFGIINGGEKLNEIKLPQPVLKGTYSVEEALKNRRSVRKYKNSPLTLKEVSQILWACDGKTIEWGGKTAPSAGATYPLEIYIVAGNVEELSPGLYRYDIEKHSLFLVKPGDLRKNISMGAWNQKMLIEAPITVIISGIFKKTTGRYENRGERYVFMEVGHCGQNIHLQAESLGLGTVMVGAFEDKKVKEVLGIEEDIFYLCPVGKK